MPSRGKNLGVGTAPAWCGSLAAMPHFPSHSDLTPPLSTAGDTSLATIPLHRVPRRTHRRHHRQRLRSAAVELKSATTGEVVVPRRKLLTLPNAAHSAMRIAPADAGTLCRRQTPSIPRRIAGYVLKTECSMSFFLPSLMLKCRLSVTVTSPCPAYPHASQSTSSVRFISPPDDSHHHNTL